MSSAVSTAARVASEMPGLLLSTRLTVASLTPTYFATSASLRVMRASLMHSDANRCTRLPYYAIVAGGPRFDRAPFMRPGAGSLIGGGVDPRRQVAAGPAHDNPRRRRPGPAPP